MSIGELGSAAMGLYACEFERCTGDRGCGGVRAEAQISSVSALTSVVVHFINYFFELENASNKQHTALR